MQTSPNWPSDVYTHCQRLSCSRSLSHSPPAPAGPAGGWWHQRQSPGERMGIVSWVQAWSHCVPTETQPRGWRSRRIGQMGGAEGCFCVTGKMEMGPHRENEAAAGKTRKEMSGFFFFAKFINDRVSLISSENFWQKNLLLFSSCKTIKYVSKTVSEGAMTLGTVVLSCT